MEPANRFTVTKFCDRITCHGLKEIQISDSILERVFWTTLFVVTVGFLGFQTYNEVVEYMDNPIITTISVEPRDVIPFPKVIICPMSFVDWQYVSWCSNESAILRRLETINQKFSTVFDGASSNWEKVAIHLPSGEFMECPDSSVPSESDEQFIKRHAFGMSMFVRQCKFNGVHVECPNVTTKVIDKEFGVCYTIDVNDDQLTAGLGLSVLIDIQSELIPAEMADGYLPIADGVKIRVQDSVDPSVLTGTLVQPGTMTNLALSIEKRKLASFTGSVTPQQCTAIGDYKFQVVHSGLKYSKQLCRTDCALHMMELFCGCATPIDSQFVNSSIALDSFCTRSQFADCVLSLLSNQSSQLHDCTRQCHVSCDQTVVKVTSSQAEFPSHRLLKRSGALSGGFIETSWNGDPQPPSSWANWASDPNSRDPWGPPIYRPEYQGPLKITEGSRMKKNIIILNIALDNLEYTIIEQNPSRTPTSLVSSIGGQAGLWAGASVFTFVQFLIYSCRLIFQK